MRDEPYDLWIGDEAWELDYFLHENPELKTAAYAWLTDFVGWLPCRAPAAREAALTADYNAEMIEQIARFPRVRDRAIFVGDAGRRRAATTSAPACRRSATGPARTTTSPATSRASTRPRSPTARRSAPSSATRPGEQVCLVTVGGSGVGGALLRRVIAGFPRGARRSCPALRMVVVAGPRIDPATLPAADGLEVRAYVHDLYRHLAACDLAVVQGGLTTTMELTANGRPFLYFPLRTTSSRRSTSATGSSATAPAGAWTSRPRRPPVIAARDRGGDRPRGRLPPGRPRTARPARRR